MIGAGELRFAKENVSLTRAGADAKIAQDVQVIGSHNATSKTSRGTPTITIR